MSENRGPLQRITSVGQDTKVYLRNDLKVDASEASFIATEQLDGDMFSFDTHSSKSDECGGVSVLANFDWTGGTFNMSVSVYYSAVLK
ncbi:hypothetical protein P7F88_10160 [Vibrio hannami]|uniref:hypothetical protein n=1 Tax=Vibrio hannami TaxID=2717094 RepID=UPI0024107A0E|nr:hypothetical protein [Vibrio hannami]MDG3086454.1 hypothetical protein [Vibrio hannami]